MKVESCILDLSEEDERTDAGETAAGPQRGQSLWREIGGGPQTLSDPQHSPIHHGDVELLPIDAT